MFLRLFLLFTLVPLSELYLLMLLGRHVGLIPTIGLVLFTGALGAWLARSQGVATWSRVRVQLAAGKVPTDALIDGLLILIAGAVLLTPGLLTDIFGFSLLIPQGRGLLRESIQARWRKKVRVSKGVVVTDEWREL